MFDWEVCKYTFFNMMKNIIIFSIKRDHKSIFRFVNILFYCDYKFNYFLV